MHRLAPWVALVGALIGCSMSHATDGGGTGMDSGADPADGGPGGRDGTAERPDSSIVEPPPGAVVCGAQVCAAGDECCFATLDMLRVESYLLFYPYDNSQMYPFEKDPPGDTLWELGLDFTVSPGKTDFRGAEQHYRLNGKERFKIFGLLVDGNKPADAGDQVIADGKKAGVVTCGMVSPLTKKSMALARLDVPIAVQGTKVEIRGKNVNGPAMAHTLPFDDPQKKKRTVAE